MDEECEKDSVDRVLFIECSIHLQPDPFARLPSKTLLAIEEKLLFC